MVTTYFGRGIIWVYPPTQDASGKWRFIYQPNQNQPEIWFFQKFLAFRGLD